MTISRGIDCADLGERGEGVLDQNIPPAIPRGRKCEQGGIRYAVCSQRVLREVDRFKQEKAEEMNKCMVLDFLLLEIDVNRAMGRAWGALVPTLATSPPRLDCLHLI